VSCVRLVWLQHSLAAAFGLSQVQWLHKRRRRISSQHLPVYSLPPSLHNTLHLFTTACLPACLPAGRIQRRHLELDRTERRLDSLQAVKPAHSAEVEGLERELGGLYSLYLHKWVGGAESAEAKGELRA
jgi:hypothetical protein